SVVQTPKRPAEPGTSMKWQEAAKRLNELRLRGEPWTSQQTMAIQIGCSAFTVNKAIQKTLELQAWAKTPASTAPPAESHNDPISDGTASSARDPAEGAADDELRRLMEEADSDERAFLNSISNAPRDYQSWYVTQPKRTRDAHRKSYMRRIESDPTAK